MTHLLSFATTRGCFGFGLFTVVLPVAGIHIVFNFGSVGQNVGNNTLFQGPTEKVELADGGLFDGWLTADLEANALTATEGVKEALGIRLEFAFVVKVYQVLAGCHIRGFNEGICHVELFGIVRNEPVNEAKTYGGSTGQNGENLLQPPRLIVEVLEPTNDEILFALNAVLECLTCGVHP